jgi:hypothetical protein
MGVSTDAILFWGIVYAEDDEIPENIDDILSDIESVDEQIECPRPEEYYSWSRMKNDPEYAQLWDDWRRRHDLWEQCRCDIGWHYSSDYPMYYICVNASRTRARRGYPQEITTITVEVDWESKLKDYCVRLNLPWHDPKWWLVSYWG